jgi:hypothetical protein
VSRVRPVSPGCRPVEPGVGLGERVPGPGIINVVHATDLEKKIVVAVQTPWAPSPACKVITHRP